MSNYPDGTWEGDPSAPWNAPDAFEGVHTCDECGREEWGYGIDGDPCGAPADDDYPEPCPGTLRAPEPFEDDDYDPHDRMDDDRDWD